MNDAGTDGLACVGLGIDQIRRRSYATSHTRYRVPEMRYTVRQLMYRYVHETHVRTREAVQVYSHIERTSSGYGCTQTARAYATCSFSQRWRAMLSTACGHNVLDVRVAQVEVES